MRASLAPAGDPYKDPFFGIQMTGGSSGVANSWVQYREIGAAMRTMLVAAAAAQWQVPVSACTTDAGMVRSGTHSATYASLAAAAAKQPVPDKVALKAPSAYRIIGKGQQRLDAVAGATGKKHYGIDMHLPGMKVAVLLRARPSGARLKASMRRRPRP